MIEAKGTVLVVDDDADIRDILEEILQHEGYDAITASDGVEALEVLKTVEPDLILLDLMMPVLNGMEFLNYRRRRANLAKIPVIVISADPEAEHKTLPLGAARVCKKPLALPQLLTHIHEKVSEPCQFHISATIGARLSGEAGVVPAMELPVSSRSVDLRAFA